MKYLLLILLTSLSLFGKSNTQEKITLKNGSVFISKILKEYESHLIIDVGSDLIKISKSDIQFRVPSSPSPKKTQTQDKQSDIYTIGRRNTAPVKELVDRVNESVVMVKTPRGLGSGVIISDDGYLLTNYHVVEKETQISVTLYKKAKNTFEKIELKKVKIIALQPYRDIALLKLDLSEKEGLSFKPAPFSPDFKIDPGNLIFAIGSPLGLERTVTQGIVSSNMRNIGQLRFIQTDTAINPGNSGGPLFNSKGEIVGLVCAGSAQFQGLGFGIPMSDIINFLTHRSAYLYDESQPQNGINYHQPPYIEKKESK
ncbi:trypsin-like peptidase domain-containing protein [Lentisphaera profundi]|uniref:Trypsin-like peptidase domain-containing protein n=1 Tax=Lentisphaera profundi TaxID=1658616 RepID=A0ABY7VRG6_9BACT|nr:trypsin-like peptidase domain-containing protein [Lentisphaera profundi]WDE95456.1 trypsin-like peptidase domain-containing protein [Lentisphaera profundi]